MWRTPLADYHRGDEGNEEFCLFIPDNDSGILVQWISLALNGRRIGVKSFKQ